MGYIYLNVVVMGYKGSIHSISTRFINQSSLDRIISNVNKTGRKNTPEYNILPTCSAGA